MHTRRALVFLALVATVLVACSSSAQPVWTYAPTPPPTPAPSGASASAAPSAAAVEVMPRRASRRRSFSSARSTRIRAEFSFTPQAAPTSANARPSK